MANWVTQGNNINNPNNDWLGTTNNQPLVIRTNNTERMRVTPNGDLMASRNATIGAGGDAVLKTRHVVGKSGANDNDDALHLNWATGHPVFIGNPNRPAALAVSGEATIGAGGDAVLKTRHVVGKGSGNDNDDALHLNWATGRPVYIGNPNRPATLSVNGDAEVTGDIRLFGADCAENFDVSEAETAEPGTVMVIDQEGTLKPSEQAYDKRVAGVVSGAGGLKPGIILDKRESNEGRLAVALIGKVACKADARYSPIEVGDLLTTSPTAGYAMKAKDSRRAFGAVLGKALRALNEGTDTIPVMVALQ
jgi:hypothetical protein